MPNETLLLRAKLAPPRLHRLLLPRPALAARLREALDYRVTLLQAGTGYGKTTALVALADGELPLLWYSVGESDTDPQIFLSYLIAACAAVLPSLSDLPAATLRERRGEAGSAAWTAALDALLNAVGEALAGPAILVLDDYHFVAGSPEIRALTDRLIAYAPRDLRVVISSRYPLAGGELLRWRARGEVLELGREALAFDADEIAALFREVYGMGLADADVAALAHQTEGWPIALQLVWQGLRGGSSRGLSDLLTDRPASLAALFDYLAGDVLGRQPAGLAAFMRETALLRELTPAACDAVRQAHDGAAMIEQLRDRDLFVVEIGPELLRYHHLFHDFLRQQAASDPAMEDRRRRAAHFYADRGDEEEAIYHWLAARDYDEAAAAVARAGETALRAGRLDTLAGWIDALPSEVFSARPRLIGYMGDLYRLRSRFDEALSWYAQSEAACRERRDQPGVSRALRGQALVYIDQVLPAQAESLLQEALRISDGLDDRHARARLLDLLAENKLNMGKPDEAEALRAEARTLREEGPVEDLLSVRVKLRTGRLAEARAILEGWAEEERLASERGQRHTPRGHRETVLVLSLIHSFCGEAERAAERAEIGVAVGERLGSPFITAVAHMRLGHALQLRAGGPPPRDESLAIYQRAIALGDRLAVRRIRAEANWGLTRAYGFSGDLESAARCAREGAEISLWAGDQWVAAMIELTLGASYVLAERPVEGLKILERALALMRECGDSFGRAAARLWMAIAHGDLGQRQHAAACVDDLLALCAANGYDFLLMRSSFLGLPDPRRAVPLLLAARARSAHGDYAGRLLAGLGLGELQSHPGYQLRVQTLGAFQVWRGAQEIDARAWQRDKARQLFQLLVTRRGRWLQREEIVDLLWPQLGREAAGRDFKVALNALNKALEPSRAADTPAAYIARDGSAYRLRPEADLWLDCAVFADACTEGLGMLDVGSADEGVAALTRALGLYAGGYLPDTAYEDWAAAERERLRAVFLRAADRLAAALVELGQNDVALEVCRRILAEDSCWERAYRLQMLVHARQGNRPQALRCYQRCADTLDAELGLPPARATRELHERIRHGDASLPRVTDL
ncbi:tetratricopeptide repeat protein [Chloroflexales bacterium ZM16-3]|nr:tetratricopeptide repeat protein [Chloroflexales bacterium ZM16-3]